MDDMAQVTSDECSNWMARSSVRTRDNTWALDALNHNPPRHLPSRDPVLGSTLQDKRSPNIQSGRTIEQHRTDNEHGALPVSESGHCRA
jgi:hypothetical protein